MIEYKYQKRISHNNPNDGKFAFQGGMTSTYHVYRDGVFVDSFLKVENMRKVLGPAKFIKMKERRHEV